MLESVVCVHDWSLISGMEVKRNILATYNGKLGCQSRKAFLCRASVC